MTPTLSIANRPKIIHLSTPPQSLLEDVRRGLSKAQKSLPSKLFYDDVGSSLFNRIMRMKEYYPSVAEREILTDHAGQIADMVPDAPFILLDLGSGDGTKTRLLLDELMRRGRDFRYVPVDISGSAVEDQLNDLERQLSDLKTEGIVGDFFSALANLRRAYKSVPIFALFLGGNIGNFEHKNALSFLRNLFNLLAPGDKLLCGFDLQKDPNVIRLAYDDPAGITAAFNYNLLMRLNRELGANFDLNDFVHYATYEPLDGVARSFLLSTKKQQVWFEAFGESVSFEAWESIHTENSFKYTLEGLTEMAGKTGFAPLTNLLDSRQYFTDTIWQRQ